MDVREILEEVKKGTMDTAAAEELLRANPASRSYEEMGYAKLDTDRRERSDFAEVVYCQGKSDKFIADIFQKLYELDGEVFGTRASSHQYELVKERIPDISYDPVSHILKKEKEGKKRIAASRSAQAARRTFPSPKKRPRRLNTSARMSSAFTTWV